MGSSVRDEDGRDLWRGWQQGAGQQAPAPDSLTLAAWIDGRLEEQEAATVERWIARAPEAVELIAAVRDALEDEVAGDVPQPLRLRLKAMRPAAPSRRGRFLQVEVAEAARWAAVLLLSVLLGGGGFWMGQATGMAIGSQPDAAGLEELALLGDADSLL